MILVVRENYTEKRDLEACIRQMELAHVNVIGCVWNEAREKGSKKYKRYSKGYRYGYNTDKKGKKTSAN